MQWNGEGADHLCSLMAERFPDMDSFQIEDSLEVDPGRPRRGLPGADCAVWIDNRLIY